MSSFLARHGRTIATLLLAVSALHGDVLAAHAPSDLRDLELRVSEHPRKAVEDALKWQADALRSGDRALQLKSLRLQALANGQLEDEGKLLDVASRGLALATEMQHREGETEFLAARAVSRQLAGKYAEAAKEFEEAMKVAEGYGLDDHVARISIERGRVELAVGRIPEALEWTMKGHARYERMGDRFGMSNALSSLANIHGRDNATPADLEKAVGYHTRSLELAQPDGGRSDRAIDFFNLGTMHLRLKAFELSRSYLQRALALFKDLEDPVGMAYCYHRLGLLETDLNNPREALALQDRALETFRNTGDKVLELRTQLARADLLTRLDRKRDGLDALAKARELSDRLAAPRLSERYQETAAGIYARLGDYEKAYAAAVMQAAASKKVDELAKTERASEMQARFELQQKEAENTVLRARERESEARRLALVLSLILSLVILGALAFILADYIRRHRRVANLALRDDLTGIANRRSIVEYGRMQIRQCKRADEGMTIALIDLDRFKSINDELGHAVGDRVLMAFAQKSTQQLRSLDRLGRFGGEEFLLVMPGADTTQIAHVFERLRKAVNETPVDGLPGGRELTFSMGAAEFRGVTDDLETLIQRADRALYRAKESGRDRFEIG